MEYKIYETLFEHKKKLNELKKKHNEETPSDFDGFTSNLFNIEPGQKMKNLNLINYQMIINQLSKKD